MTVEVQLRFLVCLEDCIRTVLLGLPSEVFSFDVVGIEENAPVLCFVIRFDDEDISSSHWRLRRVF